MLMQRAILDSTAGKCCFSIRGTRCWGSPFWRQRQILVSRGKRAQRHPTTTSASADFYSIVNKPAMSTRGRAGATLLYGGPLYLCIDSGTPDAQLRNCSMVFSPVARRGPCLQKLHITAPLCHMEALAARIWTPGIELGFILHSPLMAGPGSTSQEAEETPANVLLGGPQLFKHAGKRALRAFIRATGALRRFGWLGFWLQLILTTASAVLLVCAACRLTSSFGKTRHGERGEGVPSRHALKTTKCTLPVLASHCPRAQSMLESSRIFS